MRSFRTVRVTVLVIAAPLLLATAGLMHLWGRPRRDAEGALTVLAWAGCLWFAAYYSGLDAVAGISAGTVVDHGVRGAAGPLFVVGDELGRAGVYGLAVASFATCTVLWRRHGVWVLPVAAVLFAACWSFVDSHIFWPKGVFTMLGFAAAFALLTVAAARPAEAAPTG